MRAKTRDLLTLRWQSEANLSLFLFLLVTVGFVLPSLGFEKSNLPLYEISCFPSLWSLGQRSPGETENCSW
jgi:hypothetical protein